MRVRVLLFTLFAFFIFTACACSVLLGPGTLVEPAEESPAAGGPRDAAAPTRVMSYNVLINWPKDGFESWRKRRDHVAAIIRRYDPDLIGLQEPAAKQLRNLADRVPGYAEVRLPNYSDSTIWFRTVRYTLLEQGMFWLSDEPDKSFSRNKAWGNTLFRYVVWARFSDRATGERLVFVNTHFDNTAPFQPSAAPMFLERVESIAAGDPLIVTGDFNSTPETTAYKLLTAPRGQFALRDTFGLAASPDLGGSDSTHNGPGRIDHVFVGPGAWSVSSWRVDRTRYGDGLHPSDHDAVIVELSPAR